MIKNNLKNPSLPLAEAFKPCWRHPYDFNVGGMAVGSNPPQPIFYSKLGNLMNKSY